MKIIKRILLFLLIIIVLVGIYSWVKFLIYNQETKTMNASARKNASGQFIELSGGLHIMNPAELILVKSLYWFMVLVFPIIYGMERMTVL